MDAKREGTHISGMPCSAIPEPPSPHLRTTLATASPFALMALISFATCVIWVILAATGFGANEVQASQPRREYFYAGGEYTNITVSTHVPVA
jgi:hypothetical protein